MCKVLQSPFLLFTFLFFGFFAVNGQDNIKPFTAIDIGNDAAARSFAQRTMHYKLDLSQFNLSGRNAFASLDITLPTLSGDKVLILDRVELLADDYKLITDKEKVKTSKSSQYFYRGKVKGEEKSMVGMSIIDDEIHLMIYDGDGTYEVKRVYEYKDTYSGIYSNEILNPEFIACQTDTEINLNEKVKSPEYSQRSGPLECVEIYLEIDYKSFQENNSNVSDTEQWALAIMFQVSLFYADSGIPIKVSAIKIYTSNDSDPYRIHGNTSDMLTAFRDSMSNQGFDGRLAHLLSGRGVGGGIAYLNVLCSSTYNVAVSGNLGPGGTSYTTYTWNINVIAHELGHNFGSQHTHDCVWNGNNTQIDDCGNKYYEDKNQTEYIGSCYDEENVILPGSSATIMSYCHVVGGASINLNLGFHPLVRERIYANYAASNCGGDESCVGVPPLNNICERAQHLSPIRNCNVFTYDNLYATDSGESPAFSCNGTSAVKDVWFQIEIPSNGKLIIETKPINNGLSDLVIEVYSGDCGSLSLEWCDDNSGEDNHAKIVIDDIAFANQELMIRIVESNDNEGLFGLCSYSSDLPCADVIDDLNAFYSSMNGADWINKSGWDDGFSGIDCNYCSWYGITCDQSENIIGIDLANNNLSGTLDNSLAGLNSLKNLDLSDNEISGVFLESSINTVELLSLNISNNNFQGIFPVSVITAPKIVDLVASNNGFSGPLPEFSYSTKINYLDFANNNFNGCFPSVYTRFNSRGEVNLSGNVELAFNGEFYGRTSYYAGFDLDKDGFCFEVDDCDDFNNTVYDGADEICDGLDNNCNGEADEGMNNGPNIWIGPATGGTWNDSLNWSMSHPPLACEDVEVGTEGSAVNISYRTGQGYMDQYMRSILIGPNSEINLDDRFSMYIKNGFVENHGTLNINNYFSFSDLDPSRSGIVNTGILNISENGSLNIYKAGIHGIYNQSGGVINNYGYLTIDSNHPVNGKAGIKNENIINNFNSLNVIGDIKEDKLLLEEGSQLNNSGNITLGGESWGGGN